MTLRSAAGVVAALLVAALLGGCESYVQGAETRTVGEFTDDVTIQALVKTRLLRDPDTSGMRINVNVRQGVVTLAGTLDSTDERRRAAEIAAGVPNVVEVVNELLVPE